MNTKPKLILHVGPHKTGTTSLQKFLHQNQEILLQFGTYYPIVANQINHHLYRQKLSEEQDKSIWFKLKTETELLKMERIVISSETFSSDMRSASSKQAYTWLKNQFDVEVIYVLRSPDIMLESSFVELTKAGRIRGNFESFVPTYPIETVEHLKFLSQRFGDKLKILRLNEADKSQLYRDFIHTLGLPLEAFKAPEKPLNTRISINQLRALLLIMPIALKGLKKPQLDLLKHDTMAWFEQFQEATMNWPGATRYRLMAHEDAVKMIESFNQRLKSLEIWGKQGFEPFPIPDAYTAEKLNTGLLPNQCLQDIIALAHQNWYRRFQNTIAKLKKQDASKSAGL